MGALLRRDIDAQIPIIKILAKLAIRETARSHWKGEFPAIRHEFSHQSTRLTADSAEKLSRLLTGVHCGLLATSFFQRARLE